MVKGAGGGHREKWLCKEISRHCVCVRGAVGVGDGRTEVVSHIKPMDMCATPPSQSFRHTKRTIERM